MANDLKRVYKPNSNIYRYTVSMSYLVNDETHIFEPMCIKSIAIDSDYKNANMPMIFVTVSLNKRLIDLMIQNQDSGIIIMNIQRSVTNSDMPDLYEDYINDRFIYFIADDINKIDEIDYADSNADREDIYKLISIGLLSLDHVNKNKKEISGVLNGNLASIIFYTIGHYPVLIEPLANNIQISRFMPPMNSVSKSLKYLNSLNVFYPTQYRYFMDFDCTYLLSSSGNPVKKKGEDISTVLLECRSTFTEESKLQGMIIDEAQSLYKIDCDGIDCELVDNHISEKSYSKINATDTFGANISGQLYNRTDNSIVDEKVRTIRLANNNTGLLNNIITSSDTQSIQFLVQKISLDSSVLTMNKEYIIKADDVYKTEKYNGRYILTRKRDLYIREDDTYVVNTMLLFEKVSTEDNSETTTIIK